MHVIREGDRLGEQGRWLRAGTRLREARVHRARKALEVLARMMELTDPYTSEHARDVAGCVPLAGQLLGLDGVALEELELAARFHDVGKVAVPPEVLKK